MNEITNFVLGLRITEILLREFWSLDSKLEIWIIRLQSWQILALFFQRCLSNVIGYKVG